MIYSNIKGYYGNVAWDQKRLVREARRHANAFKGIDTLVGCGLSGSIAVPVLARAFRKSFAIVRKQYEIDGGRDHNHQGRDYPLIGEIGDRWVFVDDFVCSGETRDHVLRIVELKAPDAKWVGSYLYDNVRNDDIDNNDIPWEKKARGVASWIG